MAETTNMKNIGLRGVKVADTRISDVNGTEGILIYRGYRIEALAENSTFEETAYLLLHDALPTKEQLANFARDTLKSGKVIPGYGHPVLRKTVGRVANLEQVARLGEIPVTELVNRLRVAAGLEEGDDDLGDAGTEPGTTGSKRSRSYIATHLAMRHTPPRRSTRSWKRIQAV